MLKRTLALLIAGLATMALVACTQEPKADETKPDAAAMEKAKENPAPPKAAAATAGGGGMPEAQKSGLDVNGN